MVKKKKVLSIKTPGGTITARLCKDPVFPGIDIFIKGELAALVEYVGKMFYVRTYIKNQEGPVSHRIWEE
jgi:hypothetical protein